MNGALSQQQTGNRSAAALADGILAVLDVGSTKVSCLLADMDGQGGFRILGTGTAQNLGMQGDQPGDMDQVEAAIRSAVDQAERSAGVTATGALLAVSGAQMATTAHEPTLALDGVAVTATHLAALADQLPPARSDRLVMTRHAVAFDLDGQEHVAPPFGVCGDRLTGFYVSVEADRDVVRALEESVARAHLRLLGTVSAAHVGAAAALTGEEREDGAAFVDVGHASIQMAVLAGNELVHGSSLPFGDGDVLADIAARFHLSDDQAEAIKNRYGAAMVASSDARHSLTVPDDGAGARSIGQAALNGVIEAQMTVMLEAVREELDALHFEGTVVLAGSAARLSQMDSLAEQVLGHPVRLAEPPRLKHLPASWRDPGHAVPVGLMMYAAAHPLTGPLAFDPAPGRGWRPGALRDAFRDLWPPAAPYAAPDASAGARAASETAPALGPWPRLWHWMRESF
ncbi:cell division protein FtsA [Yunchengibacter salinarum]|uniref:cell division protein FtsA n=1 Tax=Yunchengibacter salinarum TaxID=3133399 RepID=UPI0035B5EB81